MKAPSPAFFNSVAPSPAFFNSVAPSPAFFNSAAPSPAFFNPVAPAPAFFNPVAPAPANALYPAALKQFECFFFHHYYYFSFLSFLIYKYINIGWYNTSTCLYEIIIMLLEKIDTN
jgi:hypothetical protein